MSIKNTATSAVLGLLFFSLMVIYLINPQNFTITGLSVLIMAISLIIVLTGEWREIGVMAGFAALVSVVAAYLWGEARFGNTGAVLLAIIWGLLLLAFFGWVSRRAIQVPKDRAILIVNTYTGNVHLATPPLAPPRIPQLQRIMAEIPLYPLSETVDVENINTKSNQNIKRISMGIAYQVVDPLLVSRSLPNRTELQKKASAELSQTVDVARMQVEFWQRMLAMQIDMTASATIRALIYSEATNPPDVYDRRLFFATRLRQKLNEESTNWGVRITGVQMYSVEFDPALLKKPAAPAVAAPSKTEIVELEARNDATRIKMLYDAIAEAETKRVKMMIDTLRGSGLGLSNEAIEDIVFRAYRDSSEIDGEVPRLLSDSESGDTRR